MQLLITLYKIQSKSRSETVMRNFLKNWITSKIPNSVIEIDKKGNLYVTKGKSDTYPVVASHMDQVQLPTDVTTLRYKDVLFGMEYNKLSPAGLGADDKNGIWVALQCLLKFPVLKAVFFVEEEIGCCGSHEANMSFFKDARFVIQCDRKGGSDFINNASGTELCTKEFIHDACIDKFGYKTTTGFLTDVKTLKSKGLEVCCCNLSCGYYNPHTDHEMTKWSELQNCLALVMFMIKHMTKVYPHKHEVYTSKSPSTYMGNFYGAGLGSCADDIPLFDDDPLAIPTKVKRYKRCDPKLVSEQVSSLKNALREELLNSKVTNPLNFYNENKNIFNLVSYHRVVIVFNELKDELAKFSS